MKKFTTEEINGLLNRVMIEEISFSEMVEIMNERVSKANEPKFKKGDKVRIKEGVSSETHGCVYPYFTDFLSQYMGKVMTVEEYITTDIGEYVTTYEAKRGDHPFGFSEDWLEPYEGLKDGDFVAGLGCIFILHKRIDGNSAQFYVLYAKTNGKLLYHKTYFNLGGIDKLGLATESEKQELIDVLAKEGKRWNEEKKCIEDIPKFKNGDFVVGFGCVFILHTQIDEKCIQYYALYAKTNGNLYYYRTFSQSGSTYGLKLATEEEKQILIDALAKKGKIWNAEKLCIDNMQVRKFKIGDKVRIKHGVSSKTHGFVRPFFINTMDELIGKVLTVEYCDNSEVVICDGYSFLKEWLEPCEELKKGDLAVFWDSESSEARIGVYNKFYEGLPFPHIDHIGNCFRNAVKFESTKQFEKLINEEI